MVLLPQVQWAQRSDKVSLQRLYTSAASQGCMHHEVACRSEHIGCIQPVIGVHLPMLQVYLTIDLQEAKQPNIRLDNDDAGGTVSFSSAAQSHATGLEDHDYAIDVRVVASYCELLPQMQRQQSELATMPCSALVRRQQCTSMSPDV